MQGTIGVVSDGKPGHLNQSLGLAEALLRLQPELEIQEIPATPWYQAIGNGLWAGNRDKNMRLLMGAGHGTHLSLLALRRTYRCPAIVLMRPSLPGILFDLCIEPRHDGGTESERRWISEGALNRMQPAADRSKDGLILIGGPSPHFAWDDQALLVQIQCLCDGKKQWQLSGSRRTPPEFLTALSNLDVPGLTVHDAVSLPPTWLATQLPKCASCWVTPDSASMVYEALTAGCAVGVFDLPAQTGSRVATSIDGLITQELITPFQAFAQGTQPVVPAIPFAEADRCAQRILERGWL